MLQTACLVMIGRLGRFECTLGNRRAVCSLAPAFPPAYGSRLDEGWQNMRPEFRPGETLLDVDARDALPDRAEDFVRDRAQFLRDFEGGD